MSDCPPLTGESEQGALLSRPLDGPVPSLFGKQVPLQTRGRGFVCHSSTLCRATGPSYHTDPWSPTLPY